MKRRQKLPKHKSLVVAKKATKKKRVKLKPLGEPPWPKEDREVATAIASILWPQPHPKSLPKLIAAITRGVAEGRKIERGRIAMILMHYDASTTPPSRF